MPVIQFSNGTITEISRERNTTFVTADYRGGPNHRRTQQTVRLVVGPRTVIMDANGRPVPAAELRTGMTIDAAFSSAMTRSIPPQAECFFIRIVRSPERENVVTGRILNIDRSSRSFTAISDRDFSTVIRFTVSENTEILDSRGRRMNFSELRPGMRVRVRHAEFMTASIPPQTAALEIRVL